MARKRIIDARTQKDDPPPAVGRSPLRPQRFDEYVGQRDLLEKLSITLEAVRVPGSRDSVPRWPGK